MTPQMGYDRAITVFSPDGRLFQVEYAREAVKRGTTAAGVKAKDGVVLLVDKRITSRLIEAESIEKIFQIDDHIGVATSGLVADARALVDRARVEAQINMVSYDEPIGVEVIAKKICDHKQTYTQYGGVRPYGTALLIAGVDDSRPRLFESDPSGALLEYKATAIGAGRNAFMEIFESDYKEDMDIDAAIMLGMKALYTSTEGKLDAATLELGIVTLENRQFRKLSREEVSGFVSRISEELKDNIKEEKDESEKQDSEE
jgi:proteasome alpha subunit